MRGMFLAGGIVTVAIAAVSLVGTLSSHAASGGESRPASGQLTSGPAGTPSVTVDASRPPVPIVRKPVQIAPPSDPSPNSSQQAPEVWSKHEPALVTPSEPDPAQSDASWAQAPEARSPDARDPGLYPVNRERSIGYATFPLYDGRTIVVTSSQTQAFAYPAYAYEVRSDKKERHRHRGKHKKRGKGNDGD